TITKREIWDVDADSHFSFLFVFRLVGRIVPKAVLLAQFRSDATKNPLQIIQPSRIIEAPCALLRQSLEVQTCALVRDAQRFASRGNDLIPISPGGTVPFG